LIRAERPRLVLLDLILPGTDGIELMEQLPELADLPVIFISVYGRDETIARALAGGAADYVVKPFSPTELVARVQAALRVRARPETFVHGELAVDFGQRRVTVAGREIRLTAIELELLRVLSAAGGRVVTTEALLRKVWGRRDSGDTDRMRTALKKLRAKLGDDAADPTYIFNEYGIGYRFARPGGA
ncbi:MAG: response regulator transcription factor, partial [Gammaproteobacteria bacterium]|nr:response regulator transcription factor [Gammaproteobacteria bacterium]